KLATLSFSVETSIYKVYFKVCLNLLLVPRFFCRALNRFAANCEQEITCGAVVPAGFPSAKKKEATIGHSDGNLSANRSCDTGFMRDEVNISSTHYGHLIRSGSDTSSGTRSSLKV